MMRLLAEFTIEPFEPSNPGPHVRAAIEAAQRSASPGVSVEVGPFGTALLGPADEVLTLVDEVNRAAVANGASRLSIQISAVPLD